MSFPSLQRVTVTTASHLTLELYKLSAGTFAWAHSQAFDLLVFDLKVEVSAEPVVEEGLLNVTGGL